MSLVLNLLKKYSLDAVNYKYEKENSDKIKKLNNEDIKTLQNCLLGMLADIDKVCNENNINYSLIGGNILGKIRHNGFIPWDDDVDLIMVREDYDRFKIKFHDSELAKKYLLKGPGCKDGADYRCMKVYKKNTILRPILSKKNAENKVFIDIMPVDNVPKFKFHQLLKAFYCNLLIAIIGCCDFKINGNEILKDEMKKTFLGTINCAIRTILGAFFLIIPLEQWYNKFDRASVYNEETGQVTIANGKLLYMGEIVSKEMFYPLKRCEYQGINTWIINDPIAYLKHRYGEYDVIPDESHRETHTIEEIQI